ncbi:MAG: hypothetical protein COA85_09065 [Robiginitomaculum sp.]|nr:MAG: hypothetical protein COA85_09065 [Robiginitomaculum sp.]
MNTSRDKIIRYGLFGGLGFLFLLGVFALVSRDNLFRFLNDPRVPFQTYIPPTAPDYANAEAWAIAPQKTQNASVFVVTPTVYWGGKDWNTPIDAAKPRARLWRVVIPNWAGPFARAGAVSIPYYRAASLFSFLTIRSDARGARKLAYEDVLQAFDAFVAQIGGKGPIILVGAEQGGLHVLGLLQDRFNDPYLRERLAAAYILDFAVPLDLFDGPLKGLSPCRDKEDARCIVTYGPFQPREKSEIKRFAERTMVWDRNGLLHPTKGRALACVNPVLGGAVDDFAPKRLHLGGAAATGLEWGTAPVPMPAQTSAQCVDGILLVDKPKSRSLRKGMGFGKRFKPDPFNLFYEDLSKDAVQRVKNLNLRFKTEGRLAPPFENSMEVLDSPIRGVPGG